MTLIQCQYIERNYILSKINNVCGFERLGNRPVLDQLDSFNQLWDMCYHTWCEGIIGKPRFILQV